MNILKWIDEIINATVKKPMPVLSFPGARLLEITVLEMIKSADNQARCMKAVADRFDTLASVSLMDLSVEAEAFGSEVKFGENDVPTVIGSIVDTKEDAENLKIPRVGEGRTGVCIEAIKKAKALITDRPVFAGVIGPFSLSGRLMDMTEIMVKSLTEPELTHVVLSKATEFITRYALSLKAAGADGLIIAEPAAGLLSPAICKEFSSGYVKKIVDAVSDYSFIVIYHNCGNTLPLIDSILSIGAKAYHFGNAVDIEEILKKMPSDVPVMGNLSPSEHLLGGTPATVAKATKQMLKKAKGYKNYIPSSGCDIPPLTPFENIEAFFETVKNWKWE
ncbi:MAG: Uroporphyrinogen decarboxylase [Firmicutes bacterium ADurb.Bin193]|nr:MAG: Uroporphyrinogen decarboxylase [Firmicutes bacterium ADurb.Bin193]